MNLERMYRVLNNDEKFDIYYNERPVWVQSVNENNEVAKVGLLIILKKRMFLLKIYMKEVYK